MTHINKAFVQAVILCLLVFTHSVMAGDFSFGINASQQSLPVSLQVRQQIPNPNQVTDPTPRQTLNAETQVTQTQMEFELDILSTSLQLNYYFDEWVLGISHQFADENENLDLTRKLQFVADFEQSASEVFARYFYHDWSFSLSYGESDYEFSQQRIDKFLHNTLVLATRNLNDSYVSDDKYFELSVSYWLDLSKATEGLSLDTELHYSYYQTEAVQSQFTRDAILVDSQRARDFAANRNFIPGIGLATRITSKNNQSFYGFTSTLAYPFQLFSLEQFISIWYSAEYANDSDGTTTVSRLNRQRGLIVREVPFEDTVQETQDLYSYGIDYDVTVTDKVAMSLGGLKSNISEWQWQAGVFVSF